LVVWGPERGPALGALVAAALPEEDLHADEVAAVCFSAHGVVLGTPDGRAAVAVRRDLEHAAGAVVVLVVVDASARRQGRGRALLAAAEAWARAEGRSEVALGGAAGPYLWAGVDERFEGMVALATACGYRDEDTTADPGAFDMEMGLGFRADPPAGVDVRRVRRPEDVAAVRELADRHWPRWRDELDRALGHGTCHGAFAEDGRALAFGCHSVNRAGWVGPMGTDPDQRARGLGHALLDRICRDLHFAELDRAVVSWVGPEVFYAKAGAVRSRRYRRLVRRLDPAPPAPAPVPPDLRATDGA
jgi:GNAT superfamily N-acetyltransferase